MKKKHWYILSISAVLIAFLTVLSVMSTAADKKPTPTVQKPTLTANKLTPSKPVLKPVEVSFAVSLDALAKQFPEKLAVYKTSPDSEGPRQKQVLIDKLGKSAAFETNDRSGGVFCGAMDRLWAKIPGPQDKVPRPDSKKITRETQQYHAEYECHVAANGRQLFIRRAGRSRQGIHRHVRHTGGIFENLEKADSDGRPADFFPKRSGGQAQT
jgi:hypothetical protein